MEFHCLRLTPGQEIKGALTEFVKRKKLRSAFIVTCCGSVRSATLRYAEKPDGAEKKVLLYCGMTIDSGDTGEDNDDDGMTLKYMGMVTQHKQM